MFRNPFTEAQLGALVRDERYRNGHRPESSSYRRMVGRAFANAYPGEAEVDAAGRMIKPEAKVAGPDGFHIGKLDLTGPVGAGGANGKRDVAKAGRIFETLGLLDGGNSGKVELTSAIRGFQHMFSLKPDGLMKPGGETAKTLRETFGKRDGLLAATPYERQGRRAPGRSGEAVSGDDGKKGAGPSGEPGTGSRDDGEESLFDQYREDLR